MSLLRRNRRIADPDSEERFQVYWNLAGIPGLIAQTSGSAELNQALRNAASWACIDVIADAIGRTPVDAYRGTNIARLVTPAPSLLTDPSGLVLDDVWRYQLGFALATDGNAFGRVTSYTGAAYPNTVEWVDPGAVTKREVVKGVPVVTIDRQVHPLYPASDILHIAGRVVPPGSPFGLSPVEYAAKNVGTSLSAEDFGYGYFKDGAHPTAILKSKMNLTSEQAAGIKTNVRTALNNGSREPLVLSDLIDWQQIQSDPSSTQFLDVQRFAVEQVCRVWRVPPTMVYGAVSGQNVTYSSVTDADLALLKHTLDGYYVRVEKALTELLPRPQYVKVNRNAILRGDPMARSEFYTKMIATRLMSPNEARALEEMPPITDGTGDDFYGPVAPGKAEPQVPGDAPVTSTTAPGAAAPTKPAAAKTPAMPNGKGMK